MRDRESANEVVLCWSMWQKMGRVMHAKRTLVAVLALLRSRRALACRRRRCAVLLQHIHSPARVLIDAVSGVVEQPDTAGALGLPQVFEVTCKEAECHTIVYCETLFQRKEEVRHTDLCNNL